jgi:hypothetical protein
MWMKLPIVQTNSRSMDAKGLRCIESPSGKLGPVVRRILPDACRINVVTIGRGGLKGSRISSLRASKPRAPRGMLPLIKVMIIYLHMPYSTRAPTSEVQLSMCDPPALRIRHLKRSVTQGQHCLVEHGAMMQHSPIGAWKQPQVF